MKKVIIPFILLLIAGCGAKDKKLESAARIYIDNIIIDENYAGKPDSIKINRSKVFARYNVKEEDYKKFFDELSLDQRKWDKFFASAESYLDSIKGGKSLK